MVNGILQFIPSISTANPFVSYISLYVVVGLGMIREGIIDYQRKKQDKSTNRQAVLKYEPGSLTFENVFWEKLMVGDIIKLDEHAKVPADAIILATSEKNGSGYCSTATLDGEATLKPK